MLDSGVGVGNAPRACEAQRSTEAAGNAERIRSMLDRSDWKLETVQVSDALNQACRTLEELAGEQVSMHASPAAEYVDDPASRGHIIHGHVMTDDDDHILSIDSRNDLAAELAAELRRVARIYTDLADQVEARADSWKGGA